MALARIKTWSTLEDLKSADLNGEFNNILNNPGALLFPLLAAADFNLKIISNLVIERVGALPATATAGRVVQLTTDDDIYIGDGTNWQNASSGNVEQTIKVLTNKEGGSVAKGDVLTVNTGTTDAFEATDAVDDDFIGIANDAISDNATGQVVQTGYMDEVNVTGSVAIGDFLSPSTTAKKARGTGIWTDRTFGIALSADASGKVSAYIFGPTRVMRVGNYIHGCTILNNSSAPTTKTDIGTGFVEVANTDLITIVEVTAALVVDSGASGALGLDTGTIATGWYYLKVIAKSSDGTISGLMSTASGAPTYPSGYDMYKNVGRIYIVSTGPTVIRAFKCVGKGPRRKYSWISDLLNAIALGTSATFASIDITNFVPDNATIVSLMAGAGNTTTCNAEVSSNNTDPIFMVAGEADSTGAQSFFSATLYDLILETAQTIYYKRNAGSLRINVLGFEEEL